MSKSATALVEDRQRVDYGRLRNNLKQMFLEQYRLGDRVPSERELARQFSVSPLTISRALHDLAKLGVVYRKRGSGTYLSDAPVSNNVGREHNDEGPAADASHGTWELPDAKGSGKTSSQGFVAIVGGSFVLPESETGNLSRHRVASAIERELQINGMQTRVVDIGDYLVGTERAVVKELIAGGAQGVIHINLEASEDWPWTLALLDARQEFGPRFSVIDVRTSGKCRCPFDCVRIDDEWGIFLATSHLLNLGHRNIGYLSAPNGTDWIDAREMAFLRAILFWNSRDGSQARGSVIRAEIEGYSVKNSNWTQVSNDAGTRLLDRGGFTAVAALNDQTALEFCRMAESRGLRIPEDISVTGYDNIIQSATYGLTTIDASLERMGVEAANLYIRRLGEPMTTMYVDLALRPSLLTRASSGPNKFS